MEKIDQNTEKNALLPADSENQYLVETEQEPAVNRNWPMLLALAVAVFAFAVLLFFAGRWVYHELHHDSTAKPTPAVNKGPTGPSGNSSFTSTSKSNSSALATNSQLANTGPGNIAAIFLISSFAAASLHYIIGLRKQS